MDIKPIKTEVEPATSEGNRLEVLTALVELYEDERYDLPLPDSVETIVYYMERRGLSRQDLELYFGSRARVSEILNRRHLLLLEMIRRLNTELGIPIDV